MNKLLYSSWLLIALLLFAGGFHVQFAEANYCSEIFGECGTDCEWRCYNSRYVGRNPHGNSIAENGIGTFKCNRDVAKSALEMWRETVLELLSYFKRSLLLILTADKINVADSTPSKNELKSNSIHMARSSCSETWD
ncbi:hypothetical protein CRG98_022940 [Punica granatum]|uniref:Uncharacterized protein n=1 Tax=Punica granatum TaxID=22663 RepID=A0A2I0JL91_PUNGR|nr:hypothetical protein CRG98_022940 [Punica granatum]